jgi:hypothetical protein
LEISVWKRLWTCSETDKYLNTISRHKISYFSIFHTIITFNSLNLTCLIQCCLDTLLSYHIVVGLRLTKILNLRSGPVGFAVMLCCGRFSAVSVIWSTIHAM